MDFSAQNPKSTNSLNLAARVNDVQAVRRLINKINPNCVDNRGWTCLHEAAYHDSFDSLKVILNNHKVRPLVESHEGHTVLYVACENTTVTTRSIKYILENVDDIANYGSREGFTPLHLASQQGRDDVVQMLLDHGAVINVLDCDGESPLHEACHGAQHNTVNLLLHAGANPELRNDRDVTPLHIACARGCLKSVQYLLPFITDINVTDIQGNTPLLAAIQSENIELIKFLLENNADPNIRNSNGDLPILYAMDVGSVPIFELLFKVTNKDELDGFHVYSALSPPFFTIGVVDIILQSDFDIDHFSYSPHNRPSGRNLETDYDINYKEFAPLLTYLNVADYIYSLSPEKCRELLYLVLMKGLSVNAAHYHEMPPLVWLIFYYQHAVCFEEIFNVIVLHGCDVDYCRNIIYYDETPDDMLNSYGEPMLCVRHNIPQEILQHSEAMILPDSFIGAILIQPTSLLFLIPYSLYCDPEYILKFIYETKFNEKIPESVQIKLLKLVDSECEISDYSTFKLQVPSLKHLSRLKVRDLIKREGKFRKTTVQFLMAVDNTPLPRVLKDYIRFLPVK